MHKSNRGSWSTFQRKPGWVPIESNKSSRNMSSWRLISRNIVDVADLTDASATTSVNFPQLRSAHSFSKILTSSLNVEYDFHRRIERWHAESSLSNCTWSSYKFGKETWKHISWRTLLPYEPSCGLFSSSLKKNPLSEHAMRPFRVLQRRSTEGKTEMKDPMSVVIEV